MLSTLMVGNPGVGKSTLLNGLIKKAAFRSGLSIARGLTEKLQTAHDAHGNKFLDTPGLSDVSIWNQSVEAIFSALSDGGNFKIYFVLTTEDGRIRPEDKETIRLVLNSAKISEKQYSIIVNKVHESLMEILTNDYTQRNKFLSILNEGLPGTKSVFFYPLDKSLEAKSDQIPKFSLEFINFLQSSPTVYIHPNNVKRVGPSEAEQARIKTEELLRALAEEKKKADEAKREQERQQREFEARIAAQQAEQQRIAAEQAARLAQQQAQYQQQLWAAQQANDDDDVCNIM